MRSEEAAANRLVPRAPAAGSFFTAFQRDGYDDLDYLAVARVSGRTSAYCRTPLDERYLENHQIASLPELELRAAPEPGPGTEAVTTYPEWNYPTGPFWSRAGGRSRPFA